MKFDRINPRDTICLVIVIMASIFLLFSCDSGSHSLDRSLTKTGTVTFKAAYHANSGNIQRRAAVMDCSGLNIATVEAVIYDQNNGIIASGGPWPCDEGRGVIESVPAGDHRTIVIFGRDADGLVIVGGKEPDVSIIKDKENHLGTINCFAFVPSLSSPENASLAKTSTLDLSWTEVAGASEYRVIVSENSNMDDPIIDRTTESLNFVPKGLSNATIYYWQVFAIDYQGDTGTGSEIRSFNAKTRGPVATGCDHTMWIKADGTLWAWGRNQYGQLGLGDQGEGTERATPTQVGTDTNWAYVATGGYHTVAIKTNGELWAWGYNRNNELGIGNETNTPNPTRVGTDADWVAAAAGWSYYGANDTYNKGYTVALKSNGELWIWGANDFGQLGLGHTHGQITPARVGANAEWATVAAGRRHVLAIKTNGELWAWGGNEYGQLGTGDLDDRVTPLRIGTAMNWVSVSASLENTVAINANGELWSWGSNQHGQLGIDDTSEWSEPVRVGTDTDWAFAAAADGYILVAKTNGELWTWGRNEHGQLGIGDTTDRKTPNNRVGNNAEWAYACSRGDHVAAVKTSGELWTWGKNTYGELGIGTFGRKKAPIQIETDTDWASVVGGSGNTVAIKTNGELWAWGRNLYGQLGLGDTNNRIVPTKMGTASDWAFAAIKRSHTVAIKANGELWAWGTGHLGRGEYETQLAPVRIGSAADWAMVSVDLHTAAIKTNGELWIWGMNHHGHLGLGESEKDITHPAPIQVGIDTDWAYVSAGHLCTLAVKTNGELWAWGSNLHAQLGLEDGGEDTDHFSPERVGTDRDWASVSVGYYHTVAIKTTGEIWAWGRNNDGQLGLGDSEKRYFPTRIGDARDWAYVVAGDNHTLSLKTNGELWGWGGNNVAQLGDTTTALRTTPVQIGTDADWAVTNSGAYHGVALKTSGQLWAWGYNDYGEIGDGTGWEGLPVHIP